ncbi:MAG: hypothetical protein Q4D80_00800 [Pseudomonadota bacterium]|nr:hypothetical protein [Pseudomonadota bacterium]
MPRLTPKKNPQIKMYVLPLIRSANRYMAENKLFTLCVFVVNLAFMLVFKSLDGGIANPLSIIWAVAYYIFWCAFYRYYYHLKPYILSRTLLGSMAPSSKALVLMFAVVLIIAFLPMLPLFLGFNDVYLNYYERYMAAIENLSDPQEIGTSFIDILVVYGMMSLLAPHLICKPYLAWISSLRGHNASFRKAGNKTKGNYLSFVIISAMLLFPQALGDKLDHLFGLRFWLSYTVSTVIFVYTNIIFAKMYDLFYLKH